MTDEKINTFFLPYTADIESTNWSWNRKASTLKTVIIHVSNIDQKTYNYILSHNKKKTGTNLFDRKDRKKDQIHFCGESIEKLVSKLEKKSWIVYPVRLVDFWSCADNNLFLFGSEYKNVMSLHKTLAYFQVITIFNERVQMILSLKWITHVYQCTQSNSSLNDIILMNVSWNFVILNIFVVLCYATHSQRIVKTNFVHGYIIAISDN